MAEQEPSGLSFRAHELAQDAIRRLDVLESLYEERNRGDERRHQETRQLIIDLRGSFSENFQALQARLSEALAKAVEAIGKRQADHEENDERRFGVISNRSWSAMWVLNALLISVVLGLVATIWKLTGH